jgi:hypothetical protein
VEQAGARSNARTAQRCDRRGGLSTARASFRNKLARARRLASHDELAHTRAHIVALRSAQRSGLATAKASGTSWRALDGWLGMTSSPAHAQRDAAIGAAALQQRGLEELADAL